MLRGELLHSLEDTSSLSESPDNHSVRPVGVDDINRFYTDTPHYVYLEHPAYLRYLKMHKVALGQSGLEELVDIADQLATESMPRYLDAAASAYVEAALFNDRYTATDKVALIRKAEDMWQLAITQWQHVDDTFQNKEITEVDQPYRYRLNLALSPLMHSLAVGNVTSQIISQVYASIVSLGQEVSAEIQHARNNGDTEGLCSFSGLLHEMNALSTLLYMGDPRYVPLCSSARADSGYFHRNQTHDVSIINHHWGTIKKVIPVEIKAKASLGARRRYEALIIRGKIHLTPENEHSPVETNQLHARLIRGEASIADRVSLEKMSTTVRELLRLYQMGIKPEMVAMRSLTKFYDKRHVEASYPELSRTARKK